MENLENLETNFFLGKWEGILKQRGGVEDIYRFMLCFDSFDNGIFKGYSHIEVKKTGSYGTISLSGKIINNILVIKEDKIIAQDILRLSGYWCIKAYHLILEYDDNEYTLRGHWTGCGMDYPENRIFLSKTQ